MRKKISTNLSRCCPGLVALLVCAIPVQALAFDKSAPAEGLKEVSVYTLSGSIAVKTWDKASVKVEWDSDDPMDEPVLLAAEGVLRIASDPEKNSRGLTEDLALTMPAGLQLTVKSISGDVVLGGIQAGASIKTVSGEVRVDGTAGPVKIKCVSGGITLRQHSGDLTAVTVSGEIEGTGLEAALLEAKSVSGDVELTGGQLGKIRASSTSGEITLRGGLSPSADVRAKSFSGEVQVVLPAGADFQVEASTRSGSVTVQHELTGAERTSTSISGRSGKGGPRLHLSSFSGDVDVRIGGPVPAERPAP